MIEEKHTIPFDETYLTARGLKPDQVLFFDIETTGLRAATSQLYLIGLAVREPEAIRHEAPEPDTVPALQNAASCSTHIWQITQYLASSADEEIVLLSLFRQIIRRCNTVVQFNGNRFDIPYLEEKYAYYSLPSPFSDISKLDIFREIRPFRTLLGLDHLSQKSLEKFLKVPRTDPYSGGDLIDVYRFYKGGGCEIFGLDKCGALKALLLHNYEDVRGMLALTQLLSYSMIAESRSPAVVSQQDDSLFASFSIDVKVPVPVTRSCTEYEIHAEENKVTVRIPFLKGTLCHFFPDYQDYYYLPEEGIAMHKSVAVFVDPSHREKAKAGNCFVKKTSVFLPQKKELFSPSYQRFYKDKTLWFEFTRALAEDQEKLTDYIHSLI